MVKKINEIIASANFPMIIATDKNINTIRVRQYKDAKTGNIVTCNYLASPCSPITGDKLIPEGKRVMTLSKADIDSLESLGICPVCGSELKVHSSLADGITEADSIHCIVCGESLECSDEEDAEVVEQADAEPSEVEVETLSDDEKIEQAFAEDEGETPEDMENKFDNYMSQLNENYDETLEKSEENLEENKEASEVSASDENAEVEVVEEVSEEEKPHEDEEIKVDMLARFGSNPNGKAMEIISSSKDTHHYLMMAGKPVATIHKARAIVPIQNIFNDKASLLSALQSSCKNGFTKEVCSNFGIVPIVIRVQANDVVEQVIEEKQEQLEKDFNDKVEQLESDYDQCLGMAAVAVNRNLVDGVTNALADNFISKLEQMGLDDARAFVESCFAESGEDYLRSIVAQAKEYGKETPEARNVLARTILSSTFRKKDLGHKVVSNAVEDRKIEDPSFDENSFRENLRKLF